MIKESCGINLLTEPRLGDEVTIDGEYVFGVGLLGPDGLRVHPAKEPSEYSSSRDYPFFPWGRCEKLAAAAAAGSVDVRLAVYRQRWCRQQKAAPAPISD